MSYQQQKFKEIADKIRERTGTTDPIVPNDFAAKLDDVWEHGKTSGYAEGESEGRQAQHYEFWSKFQNNGNNTSYYYAFTTPNWTDATYDPPYTLKSTNMLRAFYDTNLTNTKVPIDVTSSSGTALNNAFRDAKLETIVEIKVTEKIQYNSTFLGCSKLVEIRFSGTIGQNIDFSESPLLSDESVANIKEHLNDFPSIGSTETRSIKFHKNIVDRLGDSGIAEFAAKGWSVT